jgi:hypothetical protein
MIILIVLVILCTPYVLTKLLRAQHSRTPSLAYPRRAHAEPLVGAEIDTGNQNTSAWSQLDDRQLTRLLTNSAPRTTTE